MKTDVLSAFRMLTQYFRRPWEGGSVTVLDCSDLKLTPEWIKSLCMMGLEVLNFEILNGIHLSP